jgi:hypothetical protein
VKGYGCKETSNYCPLSMKLKKCESPLSIMVTRKPIGLQEFE